MPEEFLKVVMDSNVFLRTLISGGDILKLVFDQRLKLLAPKKLIAEFEKHKEEILSKSKLPKRKFDLLLSLVLKRIIFVPEESYKSSIPQAEKLLEGHKKDREFLALCLSENVKFWTYEKKFFRLEIAISTREISRELFKISG
ncbi:MAG: hypothetical protein KJ879_02195 [Nanoarchaeota archaeon]|nr:hypothetical protein [Nanoarchaeota archaeon]